MYRTVRSAQQTDSHRKLQSTQTAIILHHDMLGVTRRMIHFLFRVSSDFSCLWSLSRVSFEQWFEHWKTGTDQQHSSICTVTICLQ